jgi:hypothetical protein
METTKSCFCIYDKIMDKQIIISSFNQTPPIEGLVTLAKSYYDSGEIISNEYLSWQYIDNPSGFPLYSLASNDNQIIGQYLVIPIRYRFNDKFYSGTLSLNTLTHPDFQGKGLFTRMANSTYELCSSSSIDFTIGFPNPLSFGGFVKKLGFSELGKCNLLIKPIRPFHVFFDLISSKKIKHGGDLPFTWLNYEKDNLILSSFNQKQKEEYNIFWDSLEKTQIITEKDFEFIKWRYFDIPGRKYHIIQSKREDKITSICILRIEKVLNTNTAVIMDFFALRSNLDDGKLLIKRLLRELKKQDINLVSILESTNISTFKILKSLKFLKVPQRFLPQPIPVIFRPHKDDEKMKDLKDFSKWSFSFGDYDIF